MQSLIHPFVTVYTDAGPICPNMLRGGHPDEANVEHEAEFPPGWEDDMQEWDAERAERETEAAHAERAAEASAYVRQQLPAARHVFVGRERREHFHEDGRRIVSWQYTISLLVGRCDWHTGIGSSYQEAAQKVVANATKSQVA